MAASEARLPDHVLTQIATFMDAKGIQCLTFNKMRDRDELKIESSEFWTAKLGAKTS